MSKLSESMAELSQRAQTAEQHTTAAVKETRDEIEKRIAQVTALEATEARAIAAVAHAIANGRDARSLADRLVAQLRDAFLSLMAPDVLQLPPMAAARAAEQGKRQAQGAKPS